MVPDLPETLYAPEQLKACFFEMEALVAWRRRQEIKHKSGSPVQAVPDFALSTELTGLLGPTDVAAAMTTVQMEQWQGHLQRWLDQPVTHLTFAAPVPPATRLAMIRWFRTNTSPDALLKFEVNRNIVGGMVVRTPGKIIDLSFRRRLVERKGLIAEILNRA
jgi:hypothetical protein